MENEFWLFIFIFIFIFTFTFIFIFIFMLGGGGNCMGKGREDFEDGGGEYTLRLNGRCRAGAEEVSFAWLAVDAQTTHRAFTSGVRVDTNDSKLLIMHALWQPGLS